MKKLMLVLLALLIVTALAIALMPASFIVSRVLPAASPVQLEDISGTVWNGRAGRVLRNGADLGRLGWRLHPKALLSGVIDADVALDGAELSGAARVSRGPDGTLDVHGGQARFPAERLAPMLDIPTLQLVGTVEVVLDRLSLRNRVPIALQGAATWRDAGVTGADQASFGTLMADFGALPGGGFGGTLGDQGGPLSLEGTFKTTLLGYEAEALLSARDGNPQVQRALRHVGEVQPDGSVYFHVAGGLGGAR